MIGHKEGDVLSMSSNTYARTYAANISTMFTEHSYLQRPHAAREAGFSQVESWWPFNASEGSPEEVDQLLHALAEANVELVALNFYAGDMANGERGVACRTDVKTQQLLIANTEQLLYIADETGCRRFNLLYGQLSGSDTITNQHQSALQAIGRAASELEKVHGTLLLEPLAKGLNGEYPLLTGDHVVELIEGPLANHKNIRLLFDLFHLGYNGEDLPSTAERLFNWIGHVQVADCPGRGEPGTGKLPICATLQTLDRLGYRGPIAGEYLPSRPTRETLDWIETK